MRWTIAFTIVLLGAGCVKTPLTLPLPEPRGREASLERTIHLRNASTKSLAVFLPQEITSATVVFKSYVPLGRVAAILYDPQIVATEAYLACPDRNSQPPELDLPLPKYERWEQIVPVIQKGWRDLQIAAPQKDNDCFSRNPDPLVYAFEVRGPATSLSTLIDHDDVRLVDLEGYGHLSTIPKP